MSPLTTLSLVSKPSVTMAPKAWLLPTPTLRAKKWKSKPCSRFVCLASAIRLRSRTEILRSECVLQSHLNLPHLHRRARDHAEALVRVRGWLAGECRSRQDIPIRVGPRWVVHHVKRLHAKAEQVSVPERHAELLVRG